MQIHRGDSKKGEVPNEAMECFSKLTEVLKSLISVDTTYIHIICTYVLYIISICILYADFERFAFLDITCPGLYCEVKWPVSLVLSHQSIVKYQLIFRFSFARLFFMS